MSSACYTNKIRVETIARNNKVEYPGRVAKNIEPLSPTCRTNPSFDVLNYKNVVAKCNRHNVSECAPVVALLRSSTIVSESNIGYNDMMFDSPDTLIVMNAGGPTEIKKVTISTGTVTNFVTTLSGFPYSAFLDGNLLYVPGNTASNSVYTVDKTTGTTAPLVAFGGPPQLPYAITWDNTNTLFVALQSSGTIRKFNKTTGAAILPTILGTLQIQTMVYDPVNTCIYATCTSDHVIQKYDIATGTVSTFAGTGAAGYSNGTRLSSQFNSPRGICYVSGKLYVGDANCVIREINITSGAVTLFAGTPGVSGNTDGATALASTFPSNIFAITPAGSVFYVLTSGGIRKLFYS